MFWSRLRSVFGGASRQDGNGPGALGGSRPWLQCPFAGFFREEQTLIGLAQQLLARKTLTQLGVTHSPSAGGAGPAGGAAHLHLGLDWYRGFHEIILIPEPVVRRQQAGRVRAGERS